MPETIHGARFRDAIAIVAGACNPSGVAYSIIAACKEIREHEPESASTSQICEDAAVRLMVYQLGSLITGLQCDLSSQLYAADVTHCKRRAAELDIRLYGQD